MNKSIVVIVGLVGYTYSIACCCVAPTGKPVRFGDQTNIVIWNPKTQTEHFVRNAYFDSRAPDFGFIAPTPSVPQLSTADEQAYVMLNGLRPAPKYRSKGMMTGAAEAPGARVLQHVNVGKYEATTLQSRNPKSIASYLKKNGYATSKDFEEWAGMYAKKGWVLTAFKVRRQKGAPSQETGIIRMSFKTSKPFNPYYVPKNNSGNNSSKLEVFFVSDAIYSATVGETERWPFGTWTSPLPSSTAKSVAEKLKLKASDIPANATITCFEKYGWLSGAKDDLYFHRS